MEHFMLVVNKYGSGYLYTDKDNFNAEGTESTFEEWRTQVAKQFDPSPIRGAVEHWAKHKGITAILEIDWEAQDYRLTMEGDIVN